MINRANSNHVFYPMEVYWLNNSMLMEELLQMLQVLAAEFMSYYSLLCSEIFSKLSYFQSASCDP